jgi:hypothetical protein
MFVAKIGVTVTESGRQRPFRYRVRDVCGEDPSAVREGEVD